MIARLVRELQIANPNMKIDRAALIEAGAKDEQFPMALHDVIAENDETSLAPLLALGDDIFDPYYADPKTGYTPLVAACKSRNAKGERRWDRVLEIVAVTNLDYELANAGYAVLIAAKENHTQLGLLAKITKDFSCFTASNGYYPQHWAIANNDVTSLQILLDNKACVDQETNNANATTPLELELSKPKPNNTILECLFECKVNVDSALLSAANDGEWDKVKLVFGLDKRIHTQLASRLLLNAIAQDKPEIVTYLIEYGAALCHDYPHQTPNAAQKAAVEEKWECVHAMLTHAKHKTIFPHIHIILTIAAAKQKWDVVRLALNMKPALHIANASEQVYEGLTLLQWLIKHGQNDLITEVINLGARRTNGTHSAIQTAVDCENEAAYKILAERGESIKTEWSNAVKNKSQQRLKFMLQHEQRNLDEVIDTYQLVDANMPDILQSALNYGVSTSNSKLSKRTTLIVYAAKNNKWDEVKIIFNHTATTLTNADLVEVMRSAAEAMNLEIMGLIINSGKLTLDQSTQGFANWVACKVIESTDLLEGLINAGWNVNNTDAYPPVLEAAEASGQPAVDTLVKHGANHRNIIIYHARCDRTSLALELLEKHYVKQPNRNESEKDKKTLAGELLHIMRDKTNVEAFKKLLDMGADINVTVDGKNIILVLAEHPSYWYTLQAVIPYLDHFPNFDRAILVKALYICVQAGASLKIVETLAHKIGRDDVAKFKEERTGNNFLQVAIELRYEEYMQLFSAMEVSKGNKNAKGETAFMMLQTLAKKDKTRAKRYSEIVMGSTEWIISAEIESDSESVSLPSVNLSTTRSLDRLKSRYSVNIDRSIASYQEFLKSLNSKPIVIGGKRHRINVAELTDNGRCDHRSKTIKEALAYLWTAACDATAISPNQAANIKTKEGIEDIITLRKLAIAERLAEATLQKKCTAGTLILLIEALNHTHPDVVVSYDEKFVEAEFDEMLENKFFDTAPRLFNALSTNDQRNTVKEFRQHRKMPPVFVAKLGEKIKAEMTREYREYGRSKKEDDNLISTCSPEKINQRRLNLPTTFFRLVAIMDSIEELIARGHDFLPTEETDLLQTMVNDACSTSYWPRSLEQECALLEKTQERCMVEYMGSSLKGLSFFSDNSSENVEQEEKKSSIWSLLPYWK